MPITSIAAPPPATLSPPSAVPGPGGTDLPVLADELLTTMASVRRTGRLLARRPVELSTLTGSQIDLVRLVRRRPGVSVTQAAEELRLAPNTVSTLVRQLTADGPLVRSVDRSDRRVARLDLTSEMRSKVDGFRDRRVAMISAAMASLSPVDRSRLAGAVTLLGKVAEQLQELPAPEASYG